MVYKMYDKSFIVLWEYMGCFELLTRMKSKQTDAKKKKGKDTLQLIFCSDWNFKEIFLKKAALYNVSQLMHFPYVIKYSVIFS